MRQSSMLTHRRDQRTFKPGMPCGDTLIGGIIFPSCQEGREEWIRRLKAKGYNYFVCFHDVQSPYALQFGFAAWAWYLYIIR